MRNASTSSLLVPAAGIRCSSSPAPRTWLTGSDGERLNPAKTWRRRALALAAVLCLGLARAQPAAALINGRLIDPTSNVTITSMTVRGGDIRLDNNQFLRFPGTTGVLRPKIGVDSGDLFRIGDSAGVHNTVLQGGNIDFRAADTSVMWMNLTGLGLGTATPFKALTLGNTKHIGFEYTTGQAASRRWVLRNDIAEYGDFVLATESTQGTADPTLKRLYISAAGDIRNDPDVHRTTITASGYLIPPDWTLAQIQAATPTLVEIGGIVNCKNCVSPNSVCQSTGTTIQGFRLGLTGTNECK